MPIHPLVAEHLPLLEGLSPFAEAGDDLSFMLQLQRFAQALTFGEPPAVPVVEDAAPGPHGPVPVRVYRPDAAGDASACLVWMRSRHAEADWLAREIATRAARVPQHLAPARARGRGARPDGRDGRRGRVAPPEPLGVRRLTGSTPGRTTASMSACPVIMSVSSIAPPGERAL